MSRTDVIAIFVLESDETSIPLRKAQEKPEDADQPAHFLSLLRTMKFVNFSLNCPINLSFPLSLTSLAVRNQYGSTIFE